MTSIEEHVDELTKLLGKSLGYLTSNSEYYESDHRPEAIGISTPPEMRKLIAQIGWPRMYLDSMEERLDVEGFRLAGKSESDERLWGWWQSNNMDEESGLAHIEAFVHGRAFVTVTAPSPDDPSVDQSTPIFRVESPMNMWVETDPVTRNVTRAIRVYQAPGAVVSSGATLFLPDRTVILTREGGYSPWRIVRTIQHNLGVVPVVPLLNRESLADRLGRSEIVPELRSVTDAAARTMMNMQAAAELMAVPQRLLFGVAQEALAADPENPTAVLEAYMARIIAVEDSDAHAMQFTAAELRNFTEVLDQLAKQAASYTGLPPQYLSFANDNPASAEAIRSSESRLVKKCERKARMFGGSWEQVMRLGMLIIDGSVPADAYRMETLWRDPSTPTYAAKADAVSKLYNNGAGVIPLERARLDLGYSSEERREMKKWDQESTTSQLSALIGGGIQEIPSPQPGDDAREATA